MTYDPEALPEMTAGELADREASELARRLRDEGEPPDEHGKAITRARRARERDLCARRLPNGGGFCILPSGHERPTNRHQPCRGIPEAYGPIAPPSDRKVMTAFRAEISEKYDDKVRAHAWIDRFGVSVPAGTAPASWWVRRCERRQS